MPPKKPVTRATTSKAISGVHNAEDDPQHTGQDEENTDFDENVQQQPGRNVEGAPNNNMDVTLRAPPNNNLDVMSREPPRKNPKITCKEGILPTDMLAPRSQSAKGESPLKP